VEIWKCIGGDAKNIKQHGSEQEVGRCLRISYVLVDPVKLISISQQEEFSNLFLNLFELCCVFTLCLFKRLREEGENSYRRLQGPLSRLWLSWIQVWRSGYNYLSKDFLSCFNWGDDWVALSFWKDWRWIQVKNIKVFVIILESRLGRTIEKIRSSNIGPDCRFSFLL